ncbi:MAG TPA: PspA/IM30 family protein [Candidatus Paenibacillus intestinavium]|nr:PspA/IM30 family protein [Candidatus Paenibacillus intestinavium]
MGILQRVVQLTKAATNEWLDKLENPETMMNHYLRDLDEKIAVAERGVLQQQVEERMLLGKHDELISYAATYEKKAVQAAAEAREVEARAALEAKLQYQEQADETVPLIKLAREAALDLELHIEALHEEKVKLQAKRTELITRVRQTHQKSSYNLQDSPSVKGFERIERKVMEWEAQHELRSILPNEYNQSSTEAIDTKQQQRNALVEEQLQQLMQKK